MNIWAYVTASLNCFCGGAKRSSRQFWVGHGDDPNLNWVGQFWFMVLFSHSWPFLVQWSLSFIYLLYIKIFLKFVQLKWTRKLVVSFLGLSFISWRIQQGQPSRLHCRIHYLFVSLMSMKPWLFSHHYANHASIIQLLWNGVGGGWSKEWPNDCLCFLPFFFSSNQKYNFINKFINQILFLKKTILN